MSESILSELSDLRLYNFSRNKNLLNLSKWFPLFSFATATIGILFIQLYFFKIPYNFYFGLIVYIFGCLLSMCIIKPYLIFSSIKQGEKNENSPEKKSKCNNENGNNKRYLPKLGKLNYFIIIIRTAFFNILNDTFVLIIFWPVYLFSIYTLLRFLELVLLQIDLHTIDLTQLLIPSNFEIDFFISIMTMIGIISGFFQLYINYYQTKVSKIATQAINEIVNEHMLLIKPKEFIEYINNKEPDGKLEAKIIKFYNNEDELLKKYIRNIQGFEKKRRKIHQKDINIYSLSSPVSIHSIKFFYYFEDYLHLENDISGYNKLINYYEGFFNDQNKKFILNLKNIDLTGLRYFILSNISFSDESIASLTNLSLKTDSSYSEEKSFDDFMKEHAKTCVFELYDILLNIDSS